MNNWQTPELHIPRSGGFNDFRRAYIYGNVAAGSVGLSAPATLGISAAAFAAEQLIKHYVGQGRKAADAWVKGPSGQDAFLKNILQPASVIAQTDPEKASQLVSQAWQNYLTSASGYASKGANEAKVIKQNLSTSSFMQTVGTLLGKNPLDPSYTAGFTGATGGQTALGQILPAVTQVLSGIDYGSGSSSGPATRAQWPEDGTTAASQVGGPDPNDPQGGINQQPPDSAGGPDPNLNVQSGAPPVTTLPAATNIPGGASTAAASAVPALAATGGSLLSRLLPSLISSGTSLLGGVVGTNAANNASNVQSNAALEAAKLNAEAGKNAIDFNKQVLAQQQKNIQPWIDSGTGALRTIGEITGAPGYSWNQTYKPPTLEEAMASPELQFQMQQGQKALEAYERANGTLLSGKAAKEINEFGQGVASQNYGNVANRALQTYQTNYGTFAGERSAQLNPQLSLAGLGQVSTSGLNSNLQTGANENANIGLTSAANVGNLNTSAAASRASGYIGQSNNWLNALRNVGNIALGVSNPLG